ncbi:Phytanoyl-CoA dioxygenase (PhyH) [Rubripirellula obstinata]|uniref:Phytanoyl-CoA dioxygenase (PhyH) n=1 Tax=Rubripirellula obstinata TaxID=406547 RepID=A0A5B1CFW2_9BACT|nr:phytanoyl-CoA dioxygenase family protein [Rubripirellula obstinata]KAA1258393.1 Phytanoyl-CoA dioxygenase (PhyH) [Rubripirellula obstinata]
MVEGDLERDGFCLLRNAVDAGTVSHLLDVCRDVFEDDSDNVRARSSRGHVYAARNLIETVPDVSTVWQSDAMLRFLREQLGDEVGLVRALFFDKPPDRTWALAWHKDTSIAVKDNSIASSSFSRPTVKAGVPHVIACDEVLRQMLTLRIHLDEVTEENGPLRVIPGSHVSSDSEGVGIDAAVDVHAAAGDVLAMRPLISHSSGSSTPGTKRHRRILHLEFASSPRLPDGMQWHDFVSPTARLAR